MNYFYKNLKYIRTKKKLSLQKMAELLNVNASTISRWENNNMGITIDNAYDISNILNIPLGDLVTKDLEYKEDVILDKNHKLDELIMEKSQDLTEEDKQKLISVIETIFDSSK